MTGIFLLDGRWGREHGTGGARGHFSDLNPAGEVADPVRPSLVSLLPPIDREDEDLRQVAAHGSPSLREDDLRSAHHARRVRPQGDYIPRGARTAPIQRCKRFLKMHECRVKYAGLF